MKEEVKDKKEEPRNIGSKILMYIFAGVAVVVALAVRSSISERQEEEELRSRYRKVIKKGFLWDSIEYHER